jgi:hypothetical protein
VILQIQENGNDLEEEGGDDFVEIDDMLLDELDLSGLSNIKHHIIINAKGSITYLRYCSFYL